MPTSLSNGTKTVMELIRLHEALESSRGVQWPPETVRAREKERERYWRLRDQIAKALDGRAQ